MRSKGRGGIPGKQRIGREKLKIFWAEIVWLPSVRRKLNTNNNTVKIYSRAFAANWIENLTYSNIFRIEGMVASFCDCFYRFVLNEEKKSSQRTLQITILLSAVLKSSEGTPSMEPSSNSRVPSVMLGKLLL